MTEHLVSLTREELQFADELGFNLAKHRERRGSKHHNNLTTSFDQRVQMNQLGTRGEAALFKFLGGKAAGAVWDTSIGDDRAWGDVPDIIHDGHSYDAKGIPQNHLALVVYPKGVRKTWRYVLVGCQGVPNFRLLGWCTGKVVLATPLVEKVKGRAAHFIEQNAQLLQDCGELIKQTPATSDMPPNQFFGHCACGLPGLYYMQLQWFCESHRFK